MSQRTVSLDEIRDAELEDGDLGAPLYPHEAACLTDAGPDAEPAPRRATTTTTTKRAA